MSDTVNAEDIRQNRIASRGWRARFFYTIAPYVPQWWWAAEAKWLALLNVVLGRPTIYGCTIWASQIKSGPKVRGLVIASNHFIAPSNPKPDHALEFSTAR